MHKKPGDVYVVHRIEEEEEEGKEKEEEEEEEEEESKRSLVSPPLSLAISASHIYKKKSPNVLQETNVRDREPLPPPPYHEDRRERVGDGGLQEG
uniref:Uncharacterized protein n=1 Tax=Vespula pensylvanica TaxID=30213 RepID=A0A834JU40_VESPE|nr:hypothetical protein H0235_016997 [Vespula pensylvanica]